jgi:hypothetical protein
MPTPEQWQAEQRAIVTTTVAQMLSLWGRVRPDAIGPSWDRLLPRAVEIVSRAQLSAADGATGYVNDSIAAQVTTPAAAPPANPDALAGVASDGRPLDTLLTLPATQAGRATAAGFTTDAALAGGRTTLVGLTATQIYDAGRVATGIGITTHPQAGGWRRQLRGSTNCSRCIILAGKWYRWNQGFLRHPRCDCVHVPSVGPKSDYAGTAGFDPQTYFESLPATDQDRIFTKAGAQAIRDGADINQVVNARRGMKTTRMYGRKILTTTEGATLRGSFGRNAIGELNREAGVRFGRATSTRYRRTSTLRVMPEEIYANARDREHAVELLRLNGFI